MVRWQQKRLKEERFVDNVISGGTTLEVVGFVEQIEVKPPIYNTTMAKIMRGGKLEFKAMIHTDEENTGKLAKLGSALGHGYSSQTDRITVRLPVNISKRKRGIPTEENLTIETGDKLLSCRLTRRICLSIYNSLYDVM